MGRCYAVQLMAPWLGGTGSQHDESASWLHSDTTCEKGGGNKHGSSPATRAVVPSWSFHEWRCAVGPTCSRGTCGSRLIGRGVDAWPRVSDKGRRLDKHVSRPTDLVFVDVWPHMRIDKRGYRLAEVVVLLPISSLHCDCSEDLSTLTCSNLSASS